MTWALVEFSQTATSGIRQIDVLISALNFTDCNVGHPSERCIDFCDTPETMHLFDGGGVTVYDNGEQFCDNWIDKLSLTAIHLSTQGSKATPTDGATRGKNLCL